MSLSTEDVSNQTEKKHFDSGTYRVPKRKVKNVLRPVIINTNEDTEQISENLTTSALDINNEQKLSDVEQQSVLSDDAQTTKSSELDKKTVETTLVSLDSIAPPLVPLVNTRVPPEQAEKVAEIVKNVRRSASFQITNNSKPMLLKQKFQQPPPPPPSSTLPTIQDDSFEVASVNSVESDEKDKLVENYPLFIYDEEFVCVLGWGYAYNTPYDYFKCLRASGTTGFKFLGVS